MTQPDPSLSPPRSAAEELKSVVDRMEAFADSSDDGYVIRNWVNELEDLVERLAVASPSGERGEPLLRKHIAALSKTLRSDASDHRYTSRAIANRLDAILSDSALPLSVEPKPEGWQPISTAPKDKRVVLLYGEQFRRRIWGRGYYFKGVPGDGEGWIGSSFFTEPEDDMRGSFEPTHWMPIPPPPPSEEPTPCREK